MAQQAISIVQTFNAPIDQVFATLSDHETFGNICGISMKRIKDGSDGANGLGSVRKISIGPLPSFEETITDFKDNEFIEYKITQGSPIKNHVGTLRFSEQGGATVLNYNILLESKIPFTTGLIKAVLQNGIAKGLKKYAHSL
jgi:uncharacterized membrane protein